MEDRRVQPHSHSLDVLMPAPLYPGGLVIKDHEIEYFLGHLAEKMASLNCMTEDCEVCVTLTRTWWEWCNSLMGPNRIRLQRTLREAGVPLPPHFGDEV